LEPEKPMEQPEALAAGQQQGPNAGRNRLEMIRFPSREARREAIRVLLACGKYEGSASDPNVWSSVRTEVVRALLHANVPFEWLTRNLP
jgi:hypothetical protein